LKCLEDVLDEPAKGRLFEFQLLLSGSGMLALDLKSGLEIGLEL